MFRIFKGARQKGWGVFAGLSLGMMFFEVELSWVESILYGAFFILSMTWNCGSFLHSECDLGYRWISKGQKKKDKRIARRFWGGEGKSFLFD